MTDSLEAATQRQYEANMALYPQKKREVEDFLQGKQADFCLCLRHLYGHMHANDVLSFPVERLAGYAEASLRAYETIDYVKTVPPEIFLSYVLNHRVNSECLDDSRGHLMDWILPFVQGKTMTQAALAVNYWCYAHATYTPADDRTLGPLSVLRRTLGRCGEESVLAVAALRSVGIPARQVYCPRWSHCDDNHAWVEVWTDGDWHYLGACEPEPVPDKGWFTAAASRAMLVHTRQWADFGDEIPLQTTPIDREIGCTARYAETRLLTVRILDSGLPQMGAEVAFQIVNYSELFTLHRCRTDKKGIARFETGLGDLCVFARHNGKMLLRKVDMRAQEGVLTLELREGLPERLAMDLVPPVGRSDVVAQTENATHEQKLRACEAHRAQIIAEFHGDSTAAGNWAEIQAFLRDDRYPQAEKEEILQTLRPKDFVDITCKTLFDALDTAHPVRGQYPADIFRNYILAPRIADEMLLPERCKIRVLFPEGFAGSAEVLAWMRKNMQILPDYGVSSYYPSAYGCLRYRQVPEFAFDMVFVALCRAFRFPARLAPDTAEGQWLDSDRWHSIRENEAAPTVTLTLENPTDRQLNYNEHISLARWVGTDFVTLRYPNLTIEERCALGLQPGWYRIITTTRQIDGTASVILRHIRLEQDAAVVLDVPPDQTAQRLQQVPLNVPEGPVKDALAEMAGQSGILIFADPGSEPTEHLLQEMLECAESFQAEGCPIRIFVARQESLQNATLQRVEAMLPAVDVRVCRDPEGEAKLHRLMRMGDLRLPFVVSVDAQSRGVYAAANYNIRMAQTLLQIDKTTNG